MCWPETSEKRAVPLVIFVFHSFQHDGKVKYKWINEWKQLLGWQLSNSAG